jgi:glycerol-3-phosphate dehydrogenase (NAD(P)+)
MLAMRPSEGSGRHQAVIGAGAWGTALAVYLAGRGTEVRLWCYLAEEAEALGVRRRSPVLPGVEIPASIRPSTDLEEVLTGADLALVVVPSHGFRATLERMVPYLSADASVVSATKGIEEDSLMLMSEVFEDVLGRSERGRFAALSGPSFAKEVALGMPTNVVVAAQDLEHSERLQAALASDLFRIYSSTDVDGVEIGGALKNVIAIAAGAAEGLGFGHNTRAALITRGLAEIGRLVVAKGGTAQTVSGLAGLGDLVLTCTGELSRNRRVGMELGKGHALADVLESLGQVAEGVKTAKSAYDLATRLGVDVPITEQVYRVLYENKSPKAAMKDLLARPLGPEADEH